MQTENRQAGFIPKTSPETADRGSSNARLQSKSKQSVPASGTVSEVMGRRWMRRVLTDADNKGPSLPWARAAKDKIKEPAK